jgi:hypothetical protein
MSVWGDEIDTQNIEIGSLTHAHRKIQHLQKRKKLKEVLSNNKDPPPPPPPLKAFTAVGSTEILQANV